MFRLTARLLAKHTTGLVGLPVVPDARNVLIGLYQKTLTQLAHFPSEAGYRVNTEKIINHRLSICQRLQEISAIESEIGCGQAEELIEHANDELELIPILLEAKCWEKETTSQ
eukprot:TRINITY_DN2630_c0_g1_i2.p1 TRINITY_DN2630_c0_g1~~TRINITY_DN2630_c0_g1_i2.p1  ORF type:complete len:113 (-),score=38.53 TRINITY_DN2630_c0_g1_i2:209-547(-)